MWTFFSALRWLILTLGQKVTRKVLISQTKKFHPYAEKWINPHLLSCFPVSEIKNFFPALSLLTIQMHLNAIMYSHQKFELNSNFKFKLFHLIPYLWKFLFLCLFTVEWVGVSTMSAPQDTLHYGEPIEIACSINCPDPQNEWISTLVIF